MSTGRWLPRQWPMVVEVSNETEAPARIEAGGALPDARFDGSTALCKVRVPFSTSKLKTT
ncbi:MAG: hypothetical protein KF909_04960 [Rhodocyclaceae bacterium]|nr:hypothetical protein [Rhodocyclaceae bacterium]MCP5239757.1 hypothetical protein [Zoogloeaceae bacterium]MCB1913255.1 hypothetical protein [Rhodocyclaceae bacterium]MCP5254006.1 hypothetical protein [Zoogloeaceae bacterium]MCP5293602.1 hypothetical protein [Zoogloeaceae bacterium]